LPPPPTTPITTRTCRPLARVPTTTATRKCQSTSALPAAQPSLRAGRQKRSVPTVPRLSRWICADWPAACLRGWICTRLHTYLDPLQWRMSVRSSTCRDH
jgi:hypothetical protein